MDGLRRLLSYGRRAADDFHMIDEGDRIAVGLSGGKDSLALLCMLAALRRFYPKPFSLRAMTVDMGREGMDYTNLRSFCEQMEVPFVLVPSEIAKIVFEVRKEQNPCALCANLRRGVLNTAAVAQGCNKVALGHHFDDVVETFLLNLFYEGRIGSFRPVTHLDRTGITVIRPMLYAPEKDLRYFARKNDLPVIDSRCPADKHTQREEIKQLLARLEKENKGLKHRIFGAMQRADIDGYGMEKTARRLPIISEKKE
ncbi:MAG: ATP-binding protein [Eubacteriales bacterium]|nr:ATP-binding protein [Eubacteriales bacterium]